MDYSDSQPVYTYQTTSRFVKMKNGDKYFYITTSLPGRQSFQIQLPHGLECWHCIIQWTYVAGELNKQY